MAPTKNVNTMRMTFSCTQETVAAARAVNRAESHCKLAEVPLRTGPSTGSGNERRVGRRHRDDRAAGVIEAAVAGRADHQPLQPSVDRCSDNEQLSLFRFSHELPAS